MGKVYLFNPQTTDSSLAPLSVFVNGDPSSYRIRFTTQALDYVPYSTFGDRAGGSTPQGNKFVSQNSLLIRGVPPDELYQFDIPSHLPVTQDLILYIFQKSLILLGTNGVFLQEYTPSSAVSRRRRHRVHPADTQSTNGTVYVFNIFSELMSTFSPNGASAGPILGWSQGKQGEPPVFTPSVLQVERVLNPIDAPGHIANGTNSIFLSWPSGLHSFSLNIDGGKFPITQDLLLFILKDRWLLADQFGVQRGSGPVIPQIPNQAGFPTATRSNTTMANGIVYVFNIFSESINPFSTNGMPAGEIAGWESGGDTPFAPAQLAVNRVLNASDAPGNFVNGKNQVLFRWPSGLQHFELNIDGGEFPITQNLLLYVSRNKWTLYNEFGVLRAEGNVEGGPAFGATDKDLKPRRRSGKGKR